MISFARATGAEIEVIGAALDLYLEMCAKAILEADAKAVREEATWRRYVASELAEQVDAR